MPTTVSCCARTIFAAALLSLLAACQSAQQPADHTRLETNAEPPAAPAVAPAEATFAFEPFTGAPANIADSLSRRIGATARSENLTLVRRLDAHASYRVKGFLSATGDPTSTSLFYVFDIVDANGHRLKRITGTEISTQGASGDPWEGINDGVLDRVARRSIADIRAWLYR